MKTLVTKVIVIFSLFLFSALAHADDAIGKYQAIYSNAGNVLAVLDTQTGDVYYIKTGHKLPLGAKRSLEDA